MKKSLLPLAILILLALLFSGCGVLMCHNPNMKPKKAAVLKAFESEKGSFETAAEYLENCGFASCSVSSDDGTFFADLGTHAIGDEAAAAAIKTLWKAGCSHISKDSERNCIAFTLWWSDQDIESGVLFKLGEGEAEVEFMTQIEETDHSGWYYYVSDHNNWRVEHSK